MKLSKVIRNLFTFLLALAVFLFFFFFVGSAPEREIEWGINFSHKHASLLGLDWQETYLAILDDLGAEKLKITTNWDEIEKEKGDYNFSKIDWQLEEAQKREAEVLLVVGMKTPRWPECHIPDWAEGLSPQKREEAVNLLVKKVVSRYGDHPAIWAFQIENEPFLDFGICPKRPEGFLSEKIDIARSNTQKPIVVSDSGEWSFWSRAAKAGDMVATTIYRKAWFKEVGQYYTYPLPPVFYYRKSMVVKKLFKKEVICGELQAEPWGPVLLYDLTREEQKKSMNPEKFEEVVEYAEKTGLKEFYLWGTEWWYHLKKQGEDKIWNQVKELLER